jgi:hypothetical protein
MAGWSIHCERLSLGLESSHDPGGVHAGFDDLDGDPAVHGVYLLRQPHLAHPAFTESLQQTVWSVILSKRLICLLAVQRGQVGRRRV